MEIKKIFIGSAQPGMKLAGDVYDSDSRLIATKGTVIDEDMILRFKLYSIFSLNIEIEPQKEVITDDSDKGYFEKLHSTEEFSLFEEKFSESVDGLKINLNEIVTKNIEVDSERMLSGVREVISSNVKGHNMFDMLNCMRGYDDQTYVHSMNVALICNVMAKWLGKTDEETDIITLAGLLHDIGKLRIPVRIITKPDKLTNTEFKVIKSHPRMGYEILKDKDIDDRIKNAALMHHERLNGTGYPDKRKGNEIDDTAKIVAIADVYDAMTADRVYRRGVCPFKVIEHFERELDIYEPKYMLMFLERIAQTYVSNEVQLTNGEIGKIILINKLSLARPVVMAGSQIYDLSKQKDIEIEKLL